MDQRSPMMFRRGQGLCSKSIHDGQENVMTADGRTEKAKHRPGDASSPRRDCYVLSKRELLYVTINHPPVPRLFRRKVCWLKKRFTSMLQGTIPESGSDVTT